MRDQELIEIVAGAARITLPMMIDDGTRVRADRPGLLPTDIETARLLVDALIEGGTDQRSIEWTAEILELTAKVMSHHRHAIDNGARQAWSEVGLLFRSTGLAFADAVGRVPGTPSRLDESTLDVTQRACAALEPHIDHGAMLTMVECLDVVLTQLDRLRRATPYPSDAVGRVADALGSPGGGRHETSAN